MSKVVTRTTIFLLVMLGAGTIAQASLFDPVVLYPTVGPTPRSVCVYDLNGDTYNDLAVVGPGNYTNSYMGSADIYLNNGDGTFAAAVNYPTDTYTWRVRIADMDGVNGPDLITANMKSSAPGSISVLLNNGDGTFAAATNYAAVTRVHTVDCADFDGDTDIDVVIGFYQDTRVAVYLNDGNGALTFSSYYTGSGSASQGVCAADLDGDTDIDIAVANADWGVSVLMNNGDGTFAAAVDYSTGSGSWPRDIIAVDLDGDTNLDLVAAKLNGDGGPTVLMNNGDGTFQSYVNYPTHDGSMTVFACDINDDSEYDIAVTGATDSLAILLGNGDGTFQSYVSYHTDTAGSDDVTGPKGVYGGDLNGDGKDDLAIANSSLNKISIFMQADGSVDVDDNYLHSLPQDFSLTQNYPNPFNLSTVIQFDLPRRSNVEIKIYNILGKAIRDLVNEKLPTGQHNITWDGRDNSGNIVSSGMYFYSITTDNSEETKKMVLLK
jgi:hypothetical protein